MKIKIESKELFDRRIIAVKCGYGKSRYSDQLYGSRRSDMERITTQ